MDYVVSRATPYSESNESDASIIFTVFGSGSIVTDDGRVLTNRHVADAGAEICDIFTPDYDCEISDAEVTTGDGRVFTGPLDAVMSVTYDLAIFHTNLGGKMLELGNSGGPLLNKEGQMIGLVTSGFLFSDGLNFAIPSNVARAAFVLG